MSTLSIPGSSGEVCTMILDGMVFGVDVLHVQEILRAQHLTRVPLAHSVVCGLMNLRGQIVTALDLRRRLGLPERAADRKPKNVVLRTERGVVSLLVDDVGDVIDVSGEVLERPPETLRGPIRELILGAYKLSDHLLLLLDADEVVASSL
jgi:purine-binding chemotaxis protein CheW